MIYSARSIPQRTAVGLLLLSVLPTANANCFINDVGDRVCTGLPLAARVGIGIGIFLVFMLLLFGMGVMRRRRIQRANQIYITNPNPNPNPNNAYQPYPAPEYNYNQNSFNPQGPQYPPQSHVPYDHYNNAPGYNAQPYSHPGSPPQYPSYEPPINAPPMQKE